MDTTFQTLCAQPQQGEDNSKSALTAKRVLHVPTDGHTKNARLRHLRVLLSHLVVHSAYHSLQGCKLLLSRFYGLLVFDIFQPCINVMKR